MTDQISIRRNGFTRFWTVTYPGPLIASCPWVNISTHPTFQDAVNAADRYRALHEPPQPS